MGRITPRGAANRSQPYLLLLSDSPEFLYLFERYARRGGYPSWGTAHLDEALLMAARQVPAAIVLDGLLAHQQRAAVVRQLHDEVATGAVPLLLCAERELVDPELELLTDVRLIKPVMYREFVASLKHLGVASGHADDHTPTAEATAPAPAPTDLPAQ